MHKLKESEISFDVLNFESGLFNFEGDKNLFFQIIQLFLDDLQTQIIKIEGAVEVCDPVLIKRSLHSLKGSSGAIGANRLSNTIKELERNVDMASRSEIHQMYMNLIRESKMIQSELTKLIKNN